MPGNKSRAVRREAFLAKAGRMYDQLEEWYEQHPQASFGEIEAEARIQRRDLMGFTLSELVNGRDNGYQLEEVVCKECGKNLKFEGYRSKTIVGLEGDSTLQRAYYRCPSCSDSGLFPPRSTFGVTKRSME
jgi:DNA-directed RNA polymerase subunit RPC12/RpoP